MASKYSAFNTSQLQLFPLQERQHDLTLDCLLPPVTGKQSFPDLDIVARQIHQAKAKDKASILMIGAHVLRAGVQAYIIDLLRNGYISCLAVNGACAIHDFEFALIGATTESVSHYIDNGKFGLWQETGIINDIINDAAKEKLGFGEAVGKYIVDHNLPHAESSIFAAAYQNDVPVTVHVGIGYDITHEHPNCDGAALGSCSYRDFLIFTKCMQSLTGGVVMNFGSAVMAPEVFLKALAMVRNVAAKENRSIDSFTSLVCDLRPLPDNYSQEAPKNDPSYYFRPWKTMLVRTTGNSGKSYYIQGGHRQTIPALWTALSSLEQQE